MIQLVIGGARSGKSSFAESLAGDLAEKVTYVATATADDSEMQQRIAHHQASRPQHWKLIEEKYLLSSVLKSNLADSDPMTQKNGNVMLIDCLTLWLSNWLCRIEAKLASIEEWNIEKDQFIQQLVDSPFPIVIVSNEVGSGIVPMGELSRQFVDQAGWLNQAIANVADQVTLVVAGLPVNLKDASQQSSKFKGDC